MLQKQMLTIPLGLGINTKADEKLLEQGAFNLVCENATFDKIGAVKKSQAYEALPTAYYLPTSSAGTAPGNYTSDTYKPACVATLNREVILRNQLGEYYFQHKGNFIKKSSDPLPEVKVTSSLVYPGSTTVVQTDTDYDPDENIIIMAARDGNYDGSVKTIAGQGASLVLYDNNTKSSVTTERAVATVSASVSYGFVKCGYSRVSSESYYYKVFVDTNNIMGIWTYNKYGQKHSTTHAITGIRTYDSSTDTGSIAACRSTDKTTSFFMVPTTTANTGKFVAMSGTTKTFETTFTISGSKFAGAYAFYQSGLIYLYYGDGGQIWKIVFNPNGTVNVANAAYVIGGRGVTGDQDNFQSLLFNESGVVNYLYYNGSSTNQNRSYVSSDKVNIGGSDIVLAKDQVDGVKSSYYLLGLSSVAGYAGTKTFAKLAPETALNPNGTESLFSQDQPSRFAKISDNVAVIALPKLTGNNGEFMIYGMQLVTFEINSDHTSYNRATLGSNVHFQGGIIAEFDGENLFENGFIGTQSAPTLNVAAAGSLSGTYSYVTVQKFIDKSGQVTRSAPSFATSTGVIASKKTVLTPGRAPYGLKARECIVEVYRTITGPGTTFYYVGEFLVDMYATSLATYEDNLVDASITDNTQLYTTGGVLPNDPAPACKSVIQGANRLFLIGLEDENEAAYSKKKLFGESVNFSDFFRIRFDSSQYNISSGLTAQGYMDDKYIVFKRNSIFFVSGDGPNELGLNDTFSPPELISAETGCTEPRSVVLTPLGLMFKGEKGIYLLNRGLSTEYVGSPVEAYNAYNISSAVHLDKKNQVLFTLVSDDNATNKIILVYDYFTKQWSVNNRYACLDSDVVNGDHLVLDANTNTPFTQNGTDFLDDSSAYPIRVVTPWVKVSGIQDFGRIWKALIVGKYKSAHDLTVEVYYDYDDSYVETFTITPDASDAQYQYEVKMLKQKCEAIKFEIYDSNITGESMELTALTLEVGIRKGSMKLPATRKH